MKRFSAMFAAVLLTACGTSDDIVETAATVSFTDIEGGVWYLKADGGASYITPGLPEAFKVQNMRVDARLRIRHDKVSIAGGPVADILAIQRRAADSGYAGAWVGTKYFYAEDGTLVGWSPDWPIEIAVEGSALRLTSGPSATLAEDGSLVVGRYEFEPVYSPGPPGHCAPLYLEVTGGTGHLLAADSLELTLGWLTSCGGKSTRSSARYTMERRGSLPDGFIPQL
jgi:hypothetical protein